jgi:hypothetical protein
VARVWEEVDGGQGAVGAVGAPTQRAFQDWMTAASRMALALVIIWRAAVTVEGGLLGHEPGYPSWSG